MEPPPQKKSRRNQAYFLGLAVAEAVSGATSTRIRLPVTICTWPPGGPRSILNHTSPPFLHSPENNHVASVPSHSNTRVPQAKAAIRIANSPGPIQPIVSVPWSMMLSMLLDPMGVLMTTRGVGLGGTSRVEVGQGVIFGQSAAGATAPACAAGLRSFPITCHAEARCAGRSI